MATNWAEVEAVGSTIHDAIESGSSYQLVFRKGDDSRGFYDGESWFPGLRNLRNIVKATRKEFPSRVGRRVFIQRIVGGRIGCLHVQDCGSMIL